ncbi:hypothetical protein KH5H1_57070 [Corallococcus caeni]|uniref:hypothetical protein n=1 Tax=Corallococcus caeni TaxID=3082388 RepID=UPI002956AC2C|nr:hypothetical protein KH5H1_57070 [Corallococcus sp. KH5-1]
MSRSEIQRHLEELMARGLPHRAWDAACSLIKEEGDPTLRRVLKYGFLRTYLIHRLPASFWDERRREEARRLGVTPVTSRLRVGEVAFPVVFPAQETGCFVVAAVRPIDALQDEFPRAGEVDEDARQAMQQALDAARRLMGEQRRFRVSLDKPFSEIIKGSSCGLAVALAALSCIEEHELDDGIVATGEVTRELAVNPVRDMDGKLALRREARPRAWLLCPKGDCEGEGLIPVSRLEDARTVAWQPSPEAQERALAQLKRARAEDPAHLSSRGLVKLGGGAYVTSLELLGFAVAPSLYDESKEQADSETELRRQWRDPELTPEAREELRRKLQWMEERHWGARRDRPSSFAEVLHHHLRFTVIGDPGAGKSLLTRLVFLACSPGETGERARVLLRGRAGFNSHAVAAIESLRDMLPVRLSLADFGRSLAKDAALSLEEFIRRGLREERAVPALFEGLGALLEAGRLFALCDGLDEAAEELRERVVDGLLAFARSYPRARMLVTSRSHGYYPKVEGFHHAQLALLDPSQRRQLVARLHRLVETRGRPGPEGIARARRRTNALLLAIEKREEWEQLSGNPLLLTLSALTRTNAEGVPEHQVVVFEELIQTILGKWRSALKRPPAEVDRILQVWSAVASELVHQEERDVVGRAKLLRMLSARLGGGPAPSPIDAKTALDLALEAGLVRENGATVSFWHSTFAEFLAARFLAGDGTGAVERLLKSHLTPLTLQFAAALLDRVLDAHDECNALATTLLEQDGEGVQQLLRPGLCTVSGWLVDGVRFSADTRERIWETWIEVLEKSPPSLLWGDFGRFAERVPLASLAPRLVARLVRIDTHRAEEIREGVARVVAPAARAEPAVRAACEQWMREPSHSSLRLYGAYGLARASVGAWSDEVIDALGQVRATRNYSLHAIRELVRGSGEPTLARLRELVHARLPSDEGRDKLREERSAEEVRVESELRNRRSSAASLLMVAGYWDEEIARELRLLLESPSISFHDAELQSMVRFCADEGAVREALLEWMRDSSTLGTRARNIVRDVAPLYEDMPQKVLESMAGAADKEREQLESLLVAMGEELYTLPDLLRRCLEHEERTEQRMSAARILRRLAPEDGCLHKALRRGMNGRDDAARARWAWLALGLEQGLSEAAMETLLVCSRSPDWAVRTWVYDGHPAKLMYQLRTNRLEGWLECAADRQVAAAARLDALEAVAQVQALSEQVVPILRELLHAEDMNVRRAAARKLLWRNALDDQAVTILAEAAVRAKEEEERARLWELHRTAPLAAVTVRVLLRELAHMTPPKDALNTPLETGNWPFLVSDLAKKDPSCAEDLLGALEQPGLACLAAMVALSSLIKGHAGVRDLFRERLRRARMGMSPLGQFHLIRLGLWDEKYPEAIELARAMDPSLLTQKQTDTLAGLLRSADALQEAARLWRLVLQGEDLDLVLAAAEALVAWFPDDVATWIQSTSERLSGSPSPMHRLEAARFALRYGLMEEEARTALLDCLKQDGRESMRGCDRTWLWRFGDSPSPANGLLLDELFLSSSRVDFEAMHALFGHWPEFGLQRLALWLEDDDFERFSRAVKILEKQAAYRDRVCTALGMRLSSGPAEQLEHVIQFVEEYGFYSQNMAERFLTRYVSEATSKREVRGCLGYWLNNRPELWAVFRRQEPGRHALLSDCLFEHQRVVPDAVAFAVAFVLAHAGSPQARSVGNQLQRWCKPPQARGAVRERAEARPPLWSPKDVRQWVREALAAQTISADLFAITEFDRLAALGRLPARQRIENLRRALAIDIASVEEDEDQHLYLQALAARGLLELGDRDTRIPSVLEATVHMLAKTHDFETFQFASVLKTLQPANEALRDALVRTVRGTWMLSFERLPDLFEWTGLSVEERIHVMSARLDMERGCDEAPDIFETLEKIGCPPERRASLLLDFVSMHEGRLSTSIKLALAARPELTPLQQVKLLLGAIMGAQNRDLDQALKEWIERFASRAVLADQEGRLSYGNSNYLSLRQHILARISNVDDPALVERALTELVTTRTEDLRTLHRRARTGQPLSPAEWSELLALLTLGLRDKDATRLAKEWLTLELWRTCEPARVDAWFRS